jgi:hypothetical protein
MPPFVLPDESGRLSIDPKDGGQLIAALIGAVVWIPYIRKSRRVANTFTQ